MCKRWWEGYLDSLKTAARQVMTSEASSEVGSDEECGYLTDGCDEGSPMDLDQELEGPVWDERCGEETISRPPSSEDAEFTSSPSGMDLQSADPVHDSDLPISVEEYAGAARVFGDRKNLYDQIWEGDNLHESRKVGGPFYPFSGSMEWEMVEWLHSLDVPMKKIDSFFELEYVSWRFARWFKVV